MLHTLAGLKTGILTHRLPSDLAGDSAVGFDQAANAAI
jgi:hypothetical protein